MVLELIRDMVIVLVVAVVVMVAFERMRIPAIVGLFVAGLVLGPGGLAAIHEPESVSVLAELGIVLLLFTIGMEFSLPELMRLRSPLLVGGSLQMGLTAAAGMLLATLGGRGWHEALVLGLLLSVSSSAIVLKLLQVRGELSTPHGRNSLSILVFQDLMVVPLIVALPLLAGATGEEIEVTELLGMAALTVGVVASGFWLVPRLLFQVARTGSTETFLITVLALCLGVAALSAWAGLSLALGAFLAGLLIASSDYGRQALGSVTPLRDVFLSFFFVSVGMLVDPGLLAERIWVVLPLAAVVVVLKTLTGGLAVAALGFPVRTALDTGLSLAQVGEFSFVLGQAAVGAGLLARADYQTFLTVSVATMAVTPFVIAGRERVIEPLTRSRALARFGRRRAEETALELQDHLLIVGFGVNGRNLARAARANDIPHVIVELNPVTVRAERARGEPIVFGDADNEAVLQHAAVGAARVGAVVINDPAATRRIVARLRASNPGLHIIARTRYLAEVPALHDLGADEVIPEEFETSVEIFARALRRYMIPEDEIQAHVAEIRALDYGLLRGDSATGPGRYGGAGGQEREMDVRTVRAAPHAALLGVTLADSGLRRDHAVTILAVRRGGRTIANPPADTVIQAGDVFVLLGRGSNLARAACLFGVPSEVCPILPRPGGE
ncbi:MAG: cation:proton antiporter [Thermoleophilia bacterium]|nr:cation:proton antiporter [Thermoleophilia bacterium]